jgi:hypothetical protein
VRAWPSRDDKYLTIRQLAESLVTCVDPAPGTRKEKTSRFGSPRFARRLIGIQFGGKNELAVSHFGGRKFFNHKIEKIINKLHMNNQKGFANILLIVLVVVLVGALGYVTLVKKPVSTEQQTNNSQNTQQTLPPSNNNTVTQTPPPTPVAEADINLTYPNGGEVLNVNSSVNINYKVGGALKQKISSTDKTEIYLLNSSNVLVGYVGKFDVNSTQFNWNLQQLIHNGGLDTTSAPTPAGQYRVLIVVRSPFKPSCTNCDVGVDTLDNPYTKFENGYLTNSEAAKDYGPSYKGDKPIASDVSASLFTVR